MATTASTLPPAARHIIPPWLVNLAIVLLIAAFWPLGNLFQENLDPYFYNDYLLAIGINIILAVSLNLINGITGQFSLGHAGFMAVGAYTSAVLMTHYAPSGPSQHLVFLGFLIAGGLIAALTGVVVGVPALRLRGDYLAIATLGFGEIIYVIITMIDSIGTFEVGGASGLHGIPQVTNFFWIYGWVVVTVVCIWRLTYSAKGKAFLAIREDEIAAAAMGVNTTFYKVAAFIFGAFFAGVAGGLLAMQKGNLDPGGFRFMRSIEIVVMVVLGGSGSITGSILAAALLTGTLEGLRFVKDYTPGHFDLRPVIYPTLLILLMLVRPTGLLGRKEIWWTRRIRKQGEMR